MLGKFSKESDAIEDDFSTPSIFFFTSISFLFCIVRGIRSIRFLVCMGVFSLVSPLSLMFPYGWISDRDQSKSTLNEVFGFVGIKLDRNSSTIHLHERKVFRFESIGRYLISWHQAVVGEWLSWNVSSFRSHVTL